MSSRFGGLLFIVVILALAAGAYALRRDGDAPQETRPLRLGAILPFVGEARAVGEASEKGLLMAKDDIAAHPDRYASIRIFVGDSAFDPGRGKEVAEKLVEEADLLFSSFSYVTTGVNPVAMAAGVPLFYDSCNCGFAEENPIAFQLYFDPRKECRALSEHFKGRGATKAAFLGQDVPYGKYCFEAMQEVLGVENVTVAVEAPDAMRDYASLLTSFKESGVGFIVSVPGVNNFSALFKANDVSGADLPIACFEGACLSEAITEGLSKKALTNVTGFGFSLDQGFVERAQAEGLISQGELLNAAVAHDVALYAAAASRECPDGDATCITRALETIQLPDTDAAVEATGFGPDHILDYASAYVRIENGVRREFLLEE